MSEGVFVFIELWILGFWRHSFLSHLLFFRVPCRQSLKEKKREKESRGRESKPGKGLSVESSVEKFVHEGQGSELRHLARRTRIRAETLS